MSESTPSADDARKSLFDVAADAFAEDEVPDRIRALKRMLFDLAYLLMNADGTEHVSEQRLVQELERRLEREGSVDVEGRADDLRPLLEEGPPAIRDRVQAIADEFADEAGEHARPLARRVLQFLRSLAVADANVSPEEHVLFNDLCEQWGVDMELPR